MRAWIAFALTIVFVACLAGTVPAQDKIIRSMTPDEMEEFLKGMKIEYKKSAAQKSKDVYFYDFTQNKHNVRLHFFKGKDLMLDTLYKDFPLETVNKWNMQAKFSRASLHKDSKEPYTALESNFDLLGGVTEGTIKHFFKTFDDEISGFEKFTGVTGTPSVDLPPEDDAILTKVTTGKIEQILDSLKLTFKKKALKSEDGFTYDYESNNYKIRLYYRGGKDLMLDAAFKKLPLDKINQYNFDRKFTRAVLYDQDDGQQYSTLETNLDLSAGVSENMIRHFIVNFESDLRSYAEYINNKKKAD